MPNTEQLVQHSPHPYNPTTPDEQKEMLEVIGVGSIDDLYSEIPEERQVTSLNLPPALSEPDLLRHYQALADKNITVDGNSGFVSFLGGSVFMHESRALVSHVINNPGFRTAYTPYQPEVSQGTLEGAYLFQTNIAVLTGMEVANCGMYDGNSAMAEAALMSVRINQGRNKIVMLGSIREDTQQVVETHCVPQGIEVVRTPYGQAPELDEDTAALLIQSPNTLGYIEDLEELQQQAEAVGAKTVVSTNALSLGMYKPPGDYGVDIVVGNAQVLGVAPQFGGPHVGFFATKQEHVRNMPGRIVGETVDADGKKAYVMTLRPREQDIRREKATSNICTSQQLIALATTVFTALAGPELKKLAHNNYHQAAYTAGALEMIPGVSKVEPEQHSFNEFTIQTPLNAGELNKRLFDKRIIGGRDVGSVIMNGMSLCVTDIHRVEDISRLIIAFDEISKVEGWK